MSQMLTNRQHLWPASRLTRQSDKQARRASSMWVARIGLTVASPTVLMSQPSVPRNQARAAESVVRQFPGAGPQSSPPKL